MTDAWFLSPKSTPPADGTIKNWSAWISYYFKKWFLDPYRIEPSTMDKFDEIDTDLDDVYEEITQNKTSNKKLKTKNKFNSATSRRNVTIALFGGGYGYLALQLLTLWEWHLTLGSVIALGVVALPLVIIPIVAAFFYWRWSALQARALVQKNLVYQALKSEQRKKLATLKENHKPLYFGILNKYLPNDPKYTAVTKLTNWNKFAAAFKWENIFDTVMEVLKKVSRMVLAILVIATFGFIGGISWPILLSLCAVGALAALYFEGRSQIQESNNKLKRINETIIKILENENEALGKKKKRNYGKVPATTVAVVQPIWRNAAFWKDSLFALTTVTSGYVAYSVLGILAHPAWESAPFFVAEVTLYAFGMASIAAGVIVLFNIAHNIFTYSKYAEKEASLQLEVAQLTAELSNHQKFNKSKTWKDTFSEEANDQYFDEEAKKKFIRIFTVIGLLCLSPILAILSTPITVTVIFTFIGIIAAIAVAAGIIALCDRHIRRQKAKIENRIAELEEEKIYLLEEMNKELRAENADEVDTSNTNDTSASSNTNQPTIAAIPTNANNNIGLMSSNNKIISNDGDQPQIFISPITDIIPTAAAKSTSSSSTNLNTQQPAPNKLNLQPVSQAALLLFIHKHIETVNRASQQQLSAAAAQGMNTSGTSSSNRLVAKDDVSSTTTSTNTSPSNSFSSASSTGDSSVDNYTWKERAKTPPPPVTKTEIQDNILSLSSSN